VNAFSSTGLAWGIQPIRAMRAAVTPTDQELSELSHEEPPSKTHADRYRNHNENVRLVAPG